MNKAPTTVAEFSKRAARNFLRTAVFVDDKIYAKNGRPRAKKLARPGRSATTKKVQDTHDQQDESDSYSPQELVVSFAKEQIICSLYEPSKDASMGSQGEAFKICSTADLVILDWAQHGDFGEKTTELIQHLLTSTEDPEQLRLILVYTSRNLSDVYVKLTTSLDQTFERQDQQFRLKARNCEVKILGKSITGRPKPHLEHQVEESKLADRAIAEFAMLANGILQGLVLNGLAEIRRNARRVISRFSSNLDLPFLAHRALNIGHENALKHVVPLMVSEFESVLDEGMTPHLLQFSDPNIIYDWCDQNWSVIGGTKEIFDKINKNRKPEERFPDPLDMVKRLLSDGPSSIWRDFAKKNKVREMYSFLLNEYDALTCNDAFAELMSMRTHYRDTRTLTLGTVVKTVTPKTRETRYWLCMQPLCDTVRLDEINGPRNFPFVELKVVQDPVQGFDFPVKNSSEYIFLSILNKPYRMRLLPFSGSGEEGTVITKPDKEGKFFFKAKRGGQGCIWIAQLKTEHAQRAAERFAREFSRVGLTESEWHRLMGAK